MPNKKLTEALSTLVGRVQPKHDKHGGTSRCNLSVVAFVFLSYSSGCASTSSALVEAENLPSKLLSINDFNYAGAFVLPDEKFGESDANWAEGVIEAEGDSLFIVGHSHQNAVAEFSIPPLVNSQSIDDLRSSGPPKQVFTRLLDKVSGGNPEQLDRITGLELANGKLIANAIEYYDASVDNKLTTFVVEDASAIGSSAVSGFYSMKGKVRAAGWLSSVPSQWQQLLGCTHISGNSSGTPIISRHSVGPSAFCVNLDSLDLQASKGRIKTTELLGFSFSRPLENDLNNEQGDNDLWTHLSQAKFGFIIPGTSTYATIGSSGGHRSGVGYKLSRVGEEDCAGACSNDPADNYNYYWLWDVRDLLRVKHRRLAADDVKPYEAGVFNVPFQTDKYLNAIGGGSYDEQSGILYLSVLKANTKLGPYSNPPVIVAYKIGTN